MSRAAESFFSLIFKVYNYPAVGPWPGDCRRVRCGWSPEVVMTTAAQHVLTAFDALPAADRDAVLAALLLRQPVGAGDLPEAAFEELAGELFRSYDAEESTDATSSR
jgi:hypothetical protein